jgi:DnaJ family protein C protein 13
VELCWLTCVCSALNAEELMRCGGVTVLGQLLSRCKGVMPLDASPTSPEATILTHTLRTFAGLATVPAARQQLQQNPVLVKDVVLSCGLERAPAAVDAALLCMCYMSGGGQGAGGGAVGGPAHRSCVRVVCANQGMQRNQYLSSRLP